MALSRPPAPQGPRVPLAGPPTSFPSGLQAGSSSPMGRTASGLYRISRTDLDFEQALRNGGTVQLKESPDISSMGDISTDSIEPNQRPEQPATPQVIPPSPYEDIKRRSMYRSPGTSSSPDLATLLRKAKEKQRKEKRRESPPPSSSKPVKSTVRSKTTALMGKLLGSTRERSKTDAIPPSAFPSPNIFNAFTPPVPPLPDANSYTPVGSPIADVFGPARSPPPDSATKPLPPIITSRTRTPPPEVPSKSPTASKHVKRRSMSVSEFELKNAMIASSSRTPLPASPLESRRKQDTYSWDDTTLNGIISDFKGELSQLDPASATLDLQDPSAASRSTSAPTISRPKIDLSQNDHRSQWHTSSPTVIVQATTDTTPPSSPTALIPPRTSSLQTPVPSSSRRPIYSPMQTRNGTNFGNLSPRGDTSKLRIQHRSTASSSEPSLITSGEDRLRERRLSIRLVPSRATSDNVTSKILTTPDLTRTPTQQSPEESRDIETRGSELATRCWNEDEEFLAKEKISEWLGGLGLINQVALKYYVDHFDFTGLRLDMAFRHLCSKLYLKAETQQVDRILNEFSRRYWDCNPGGVFGSASIVHSISYSLLLLNTDLHVAELSTRMSRSQFVRNTLTALLEPASQSSVTDFMSDNNSTTENSEMTVRSKRSDSLTSWNSISRETFTPSTAPTTPSHGLSMSGLEINSPTNGSMSSPVYGRAWENEMETLLKDMYNAIKSQQISQPTIPRLSMSSLSPGGMHRTRSARNPPDRLATLKRGSIRGLQSILGSQTTVSPYSSNSSIDGRVSPSPSFATSTHEAMYGSSSSFLAAPLGFASNLSHTIIRETQEDDEHDNHSHNSASTNISITDEELALLGAPWAKEGMLCRKHYWDSVGKRTKDKSWMDVFVVIHQGKLDMFIFGDRNGAGSSVVGGGNWLENAEPMGTLQLAHSLAHALPPPGYNTARPHCIVLTLATGGVYFLQAGTEELVNEWVSTCNYWAARTSKEPLAGGVSNMEYGWNRVLDQTANSDPSDALSMRSTRSTRSKFGWRDAATTGRNGQSPWADRVTIHDWTAPLPPTVSSVHDEEVQLEALQKHAATIKAELTCHNELRGPMEILYPPRSANAIKAQSNWKKKSQYLLAENTKYDSYIASLQSAMSLRLKKRGEKVLERALSSGTGEEEDINLANAWNTNTIEEAEEPITPAPDADIFHGQQH